MNKGIKDALAMGVPEEYIDKVIRPFIPDVEDESVRHIANQQALEFRQELEE